MNRRRAGWSPAFVVCTALLLSQAWLEAADVGYFGVAKSIQYEQTNQPTPALIATNAYGFTAFAIASTNGALTNATFKLSNSAQVRQLAMDTNEVSWRFEQRFATQAALDSAFPAGSLLSRVDYTLNLYGTNDGLRSASLNFFILFAQVGYPPTPGVTNLTAAQSIDTTRAFTLGWNSIGGSTLTIVQLSILDASSNVVFMSPVPFQPGALDGTSRGAVIPANTLPAGVPLIGHLSAANPGLPNTNSYPGAIGVPAMVKDTEFRLLTRAEPARPTLELISAGPEARLRVTGETARLYQVEASAQLVSWSNVASFYATNMPVELVDTNPAAGRFYRVRVGE